MTSFPILSPIRLLQQIGEPVLHLLGWPPHVPGQRPLNYWAPHLDQLPTFVQQSSLTVRYIQLLGLLDWEHLPERDLHCRWTRDPVP